MRIRWNPSLPAFATVFLGPFLVGLSVHRQGLNLLDDGLWLLGTRIVADGGTLYGDIFSIYGPARYFLLAPFFLILGKSALTLAVFKAILDGTAALFGFWYTRWMGAGRWSWLVPLGVVAIGPVYPRYLAAGLFAALVGWFLARPPTRRGATILGLAWGGLCLFGLDMAGYGAVILVAGWLFSQGSIVEKNGRSTLPILFIAGGLGGVLGVAALACLAQGILDNAFWDTVIYPVTRFGDAMGISWYESFLRDSSLHTPFSGHFTGEVLTGAWPVHLWHRALGFRAMFILIWLIPVVFLFSLRRFSDPRLGPLLALVLSGWITLLARGDIPHLRQVWFGALLVVPLLISRVPSGRSVRGVLAGLFFVVVIAPLFGEQVWLATHLDRPGLVRWERSSARVHLDFRNAEALEALCSELAWDHQSPVLVWPAQPGLQFVLGAPLATRQATLLGGEVRSPTAVIADLEEQKPEVAILGSARGLVSGVANIQGLAPELWSYLRRNYILMEQYKTTWEEFGTLARNSSPPVMSRLPGAAQVMKTSACPALGSGVSVAQSFHVGEFDLGGVTFIVRTSGPFPYPVSLVLTFFELDESGRARQLELIPADITLNKPTEAVGFSFEPISGTAGKKVLVNIEGHPDGTQPFGMLWNKATEENPSFVDYYPEGQAFFNLKPVQADLYFLSY